RHSGHATGRVSSCIWPRGSSWCAGQQANLRKEEATIDATIRREAKAIDAIRRLKTIPAGGRVGGRSRSKLRSGDVSRFPNARALTSYAGLVPSVHQSGETQRMGGITKLGSPSLRRVLVQAGHVLLSSLLSTSARKALSFSKP